MTQITAPIIAITLVLAVGIRADRPSFPEFPERCSASSR